MHLDLPFMLQEWIKIVVDYYFTFICTEDEYSSGDDDFDVEEVITTCVNIMDAYLPKNWCSAERDVFKKAIFISVCNK